MSRGRCTCGSSYVRRASSNAGVAEQHEGAGQGEYCINFSKWDGELYPHLQKGRKVSVPRTSGEVEDDWQIEYRGAVLSIYTFDQKEQRWKLDVLEPYTLYLFKKYQNEGKKVAVQQGCLVKKDRQTKCKTLLALNELNPPVGEELFLPRPQVWVDGALWTVQEKQGDAFVLTQDGQSRISKTGVSLQRENFLTLEMGTRMPFRQGEEVYVVRKTGTPEEYAEKGWFIDLFQADGPSAVMFNNEGHLDSTKSLSCGTSIAHITEIECLLSSQPVNLHPVLLELREGLCVSNSSSDGSLSVLL